jgi:hypothetical protein
MAIEVGIQLDFKAGLSLQIISEGLALSSQLRATILKLKVSLYKFKVC